MILNLSNLVIGLVYFLVFVDIVAVIGFTYNYMTRPYADGLEADYINSRRHRGYIILIVITSVVLWLLLCVNHAKLVAM